MTAHKKKSMDMLHKMFALSVCLPCAAPSEPQDLQIINVFHISLRLAWRPPASPNGIITQYTVSFVDCVVIVYLFV